MSRQILDFPSRKPSLWILVQNFFTFLPKITNKSLIVISHCLVVLLLEVPKHEILILPLLFTRKQFEWSAERIFFFSRNCFGIVNDNFMGNCNEFRERRVVIETTNTHSGRFMQQLCTHNNIIACLNNVVGLSTEKQTRNPNGQYTASGCNKCRFFFAT